MDLQTIKTSPELNPSLCLHDAATTVRCRWTGAEWQMVSWTAADPEIPDQYVTVPETIAALMATDPRIRLGFDIVVPGGSIFVLR